MIVMIERNYLHSSCVEKMNDSPQSKTSDFSAEVNLQRHVPAGVAVVSIAKVAPESAVSQEQAGVYVKGFVAGFQDDIAEIFIVPEVLQSVMEPKMKENSVQSKVQKYCSESPRSCIFSP